MDKWFRSKWFVRAVSLVFAVLFFVFVNAEMNDSQSHLRFFSGSDETETVEDVPVEIKANSDEYVVSGVPETVDVTLEGPKSVLTQTVQLEEFEVYVDLSELEEGDHTVELDYSGVPSELEAYLEPKEVDVTIEKRSTEDFDVSVEYGNTDELPEGYELGDSDVDPDQVSITSSESVIDEVAAIKAFVDVGDETDPIDKREVPVNVYDNQGKEMNVDVDPENVAVSVDVKHPKKEVPIDVSTSGELPEDLSLVSSEPDMEEIEIFATNDLLDETDAVSTEDIPLDTIEASETVEAELDLPDGVTVDNDDSIDVHFEVEKTKTIDDVPIELENASDDQDITFDEPDGGEMKVEAVGDAEDVDDLSKDDINITVDASDLDEGEHDVSVDIEEPGGVEITGEIKDVTIDVDE